MSSSGYGLQSHHSSGKGGLPQLPPGADVTNQSQTSGRTRRGRIPKNKSFGYLENLKKSASAMVKGDLIPLSDATSNVSGAKKK